MRFFCVDTDEGSGGLGGKSQDRPSLTLMIVSVNCIICPDFDSSHSLLLACRLSEQWIRLDHIYLILFHHNEYGAFL